MSYFAALSFLLLVLFVLVVIPDYCKWKREHEARRAEYLKLLAEMEEAKKRT